MDSDNMRAHREVTLQKVKKREYLGFKCIIDADTGHRKIVAW